jgi:cohesin loading factor subunit SCC2
MNSVLSGEEYQAELDVSSDVSDTAILAPLQVLSELSREVIKLRNLKLLHQIPSSYMCQLLVALNLHIKDAAEVQLDNPETVSSSQESRLWRKVCLERLLRSSEAALICLNIITAPNISKQVQLEEVIQTAVEFTRYHLRNSIYPEYDPVYMTVSKAGQGQ